MNKIVLSCCCFLLLFTLLAPSVFAHRLLIDPKEPGVIKVIYEDGSYSTRTLVYVYDKQGNEISFGKLDSNGYFHYDHEKAFIITATDGIGHRTEWTVGEQIVFKSDPHRWVTAAIVLFILGCIAVFFTCRKKYKERAPLR